MSVCLFVHPEKKKSAPIERILMKSSTDVEDFLLKFVHEI